MEGVGVNYKFRVFRILLSLDKKEVKTEVSELALPGGEISYLIKLEGSARVFMNWQGEWSLIYKDPLNSELQQAVIESIEANRTATYLSGTFPGSL